MAQGTASESQRVQIIPTARPAQKERRRMRKLLAMLSRGEVGEVIAKSDDVRLAEEEA